MRPSSRTPEGIPNRCPICGKSVHIVPSKFPTKDAPCPSCGHLLWFSADPPPTTTPTARLSSRKQFVRGSSRQEVYEQDEPFGRIERAVWGSIAVVSTCFVALNDQLILNTIVWLIGMAVFGQLVLPVVFRCVHRQVEPDEHLYSGVVCGWGLVPGPAVGVMVGVLLPCVYDLGVSSFVGGLIGLAVGPVAAAIEGVVIVGFVDLIVVITTGKSLTRHFGS